MFIIRDWSKSLLIGAVVWAMAVVYNQIDYGFEMARIFSNLPFLLAFAMVSLAIRALWFFLIYREKGSFDDRYREFRRKKTFEE